MLDRRFAHEAAAFDRSSDPASIESAYEPTSLHDLDRFDSFAIVSATI